MLRPLVNHLAQVVVYLFPAPQHLGKVGSAYHVPEGGLARPGYGVPVILNFYRRLFRINNPPEEDGIHIHGTLSLVRVSSALKGVVTVLRSIQ